MRGFQRVSGLLAAALRSQRVPRARVTSKPPEEPLSTAEQVIALSVMFSCFLIPTAWILSNLEHYKSKSD
uniref:COX8A oxidase n=1 Tax=Dromaius novaehollandiae TaxID=8790 RepID=A0A8C4J2G8_DRONO